MSIGREQQWEKVSQRVNSKKERICKVISFVNFKGGCGKTAGSDALANYLYARHYNVLVIDADPQASLSTKLGVYVGDVENSNKTLAEMFNNIYKKLTKISVLSAPLGVRRSDAPDPKDNNYLSLLVGDTALESKVANAIEECGGRRACLKKFAKVIEVYKQVYDFIIFDTAPAIKVGGDDGQGGRINDFALYVSDWLVIPFDGSEAVSGVSRVMDWVEINHDKYGIQKPNAMLMLSKYQGDIDSVSEAVDRMLVESRLERYSIEGKEEESNFMYRVLRDKIKGNVCEHGISELPTLKSKAYIGLSSKHKRLYDAVCGDIVHTVQFGNVENLCENWAKYSAEIEQYVRIFNKGKCGATDSTFSFTYTEEDALSII